MITINGVGPNRSSFAGTDTDPQHSSTGRITALALASDGIRMYAGSFAGVWKSDDGGQNWRQLTWPQPGMGIVGEIPGALYAPHVFDMAASPVDPNLVLVSAIDSQYLDGRDGIYRSTDGGANWSLVMPSTNACNIVFAPDNPQLVYAAMGSKIAVSQNAGANWNPVPAALGATAWHVAVGPLEADGITRRVYAAGDGTISYSSDGGNSWVVDAGVSTIASARGAVSQFQVSCGGNGLGSFATQTAYAVGAAGRMLAVEPGNPAKVYLATEGAANGPTFFGGTVPDGTPCNTMCARLAGEASLWLGDFSQFDATAAAQWTQLPGPPVYQGTTSPSGNCYVATKPTSSGFLVFFSDNSHVHVSAGTPAGSISWHRLDGMDASVAHESNITGNVVFVHADPHGIAFSPDFEITIAPAIAADPPFNQNSIFRDYVGGTIWMANDGGVYWSEDGGQSWKRPLGLETLDPVNIAGLFGAGTEPALYFGCGDNFDFYSLDGGVTWGDPGSGCGDCDCWFTDVAQVNRVMQFLPRGGAAGVIGVITNSDPSKYPDAGDGTSKRFVPTTQKRAVNPVRLVPYAQSGLFLRGYRPVIRTLATEAPLADGDYVFIDQTIDGVATLLRTQAISSIAQLSDWADTSKAIPIGPPLPAANPADLSTVADVVQVSGGHTNPIFYVGNPFGVVWKLDPVAMQWNQIVPNQTVGFSVGVAKQWFVDPFEPGTIYVLDFSGVKVSSDGGESWAADFWLNYAMTAGGKIAISNSILQDMLFMRGERGTRFAFGTAGVFCTTNFGVDWFCVLNSIALPGRPESGFFDPITDPSDRALYVELEGRSVIRIGGIPELSPFTPPPAFDLLEFAAILDA